MKNRTFHVACDLPFHPKIKSLKRKVGSAGCWSLVCLWSYTAGFRPDGDLSSLTPAEIEEVSQWGGKRGKFYDALIACGFLDPEHQIHDWLEYNAYASNAKARQLAAQNAALSRWSKTPLYHLSSGDGETPQKSSIPSLATPQKGSIPSLAGIKGKDGGDRATEKVRLNGLSGDAGALPRASLEPVQVASESGNAYKNEKENEKEPPPTPPWEGDSGFAKWLGGLWGWEVPRVMQYLRKARREPTTALDARGFYEDYRRERQGEPSRIDWRSHPNFAAYKARCEEDCYAFLLEFPSGSPERSLRASFVEWFLSQGKSPLGGGQDAQEDVFSCEGVPEGDYDF